MRPALAGKTPAPDRRPDPRILPAVPDGDSRAVVPTARIPHYLGRDPSNSSDWSAPGSSVDDGTVDLVPRFLLDGTGLTAALGESTGARPLDRNVRESFERSLDADLSNVRVHTDHQADRLARALGAEAFTTGSDIYFRAGRYNDASPAGARLLAHETAHTVQQSWRSIPSSTVSPAQSEYVVGRANDSLECDADQAAELMTSSQTWGHFPGNESRQSAPRAYSGTRPVSFASPVIQRQESPPEALTFGSYVQDLMKRAQKEFERKKAKQELDQLIERIKQKRDLRLKVQEHVNALNAKTFFGKTLDERERQQLDHFTGRLEVLKKEIEALQQQAIEKAIIAYDIKTGMVSSVRRADNEELFSRGVPKHGELNTETGEVSIYGSAFESSAKLGSVIGHEAESHGRQVAERRSYAGREGARNLGYTINEIEARDYEIRNAERFGTSDEYVAKAREWRETLVKTLPSDYQTRVNEGNYVLKPEDLASEEIADPDFDRHR